MSNNNLKRIDFEKGSFMANGKLYTIETGFSIERYCEYQVMEKELGFGDTVKTLYDKLIVMKASLNKGNFVDSAVSLNNILNGISKIKEREPAMIKLCTLFCNTEDEDRTVFNDDLATQKINDWKKEGIDTRDFFTLAINTMDGFINIYKEITQTTSELEKLNQNQ